MPDNNYQEVIKNNKLFDGIPSKNLEFPFQNDSVIKLREGEIIFQKGDESKFTYLVIAGRVKIKVYIENKSIKLNKIEKDFFGEIEVLEDTYRRSAAVANTDCILYLISKSELKQFLSKMPELNDNIIAYNKVEIPELKITIHPDLLKKDTDKIYLHPLKESEIKSIVNVKQQMTGDEDILMEKPEYHAEQEEETETLADNEVDAFLDIENKAGSGLAESQSDNLPEEMLEEPPGENEYHSEISEIINAFEGVEETTMEEYLPEEKEMTPEVSGYNEIKPDEIIPELPDESSVETLPDESAEPLAEVIPELHVEPSVDILQNNNDNEEKPKWFNASGKIEEEEIAQDTFEKEKEKFEAEEEKLKYDDTILNSEKILDSVLKINSGKSDHDVYSNIIRESVKLTEAQAGILYLVDTDKKQLVTEVDSEEGFIRVSFPVEEGLTGIAAETGEIMNIRQPDKDFRYSEDVDSIRGVVGSSLLCVPVINDERETIAVICLANSSSGKFRISDEEKMLCLAPHISQTIQHLSISSLSVESNKNIHLSTLTKFITDNIQTPVLTMKYYAAQIKKKNISSDVRTVLNVLMDQADAIVNFLHFTLAYTENKNSLQLGDYDLREVMDDSLGLLAEYVESRNVTLYKKIENDIKIKVDKNAFYQVCLQIAKNACDAMGENGNIYITAKRSGDLLNIEFRDTGPGIPDVIKPQIFEPFKSFNKENGTGLGLAIAQKIIRDHGGELTVESVSGEGATFIISLPSFGQI
ncbi:MAG TPA: ATP-binding protein [Ignavibacteriaceae bacterium]|nr:ATP-binding protein [Ignavibacteriaceae bacterium]